MSKIYHKLPTLAIWLGGEFVEEVLLAYNSTLRDQFLLRAVFIALCNSLVNLGERLRGHSRAPLCVFERQLESAYSDLG